MSPRNVRRHPDDPWFRIGTVEVTTTVLVVALNVIGLFVVAAEGAAGPFMPHLAMIPTEVAHGQVWRVVTWPFYSVISLGQIVAVFLFWYFGTELEKQLLRVRTAVLYLGCTLVLSAVALALSPLVPGVLAGLGLLEFIVVLIFIAEHPHARFFFNIPAWLIGAILVGLQVLSDLANRAWLELFSFLIGLVFCAIVAKSVGLFTDHAWVPSVNPKFRSRRASRRTTRKRRNPAGATVVAGPWDNLSQDQRELDALLDKVSQHGIGALTDKDRARITELRERIRRSG